MFVESMTFEEIRAEFEKEKQILTNKIIRHSDQVLKLMRKTNMSHYDKYFDYISPRKNRWVYHFEATAKGANHFTITNYCYFYTHNSYAVITYLPETNHLVYLSGHFFTRFLQREKLETESIHDIVRTYFTTNNQLATEGIKEEKPGTGIFQAFMQTKTGVGLGYVYAKIKITEMRTFITNDMLKGNQVERSKQLEEKFKMHIVRNSPGG
jgi:hypothetical protein